MNRTVDIFRAAFEPAPDGSDYAHLVPTAAVPAAFASGIVRVPPGTTTWRHNHQDTEIFVVISGRAQLCSDDGQRVVSAGDLVVLAPFTHHSVVASGDGEGVTFLTFWWTSQEAYVAAAETHARGLQEARESYVFIEESANDIVDIACRALRQQGIRVVRGGRHDATGLLEPLEARGLVTRTRSSVLFPLERHRMLVLQATDAMIVSAAAKRSIAEALTGPLPDVAIADVDANGANPRACLDLVGALIGADRGCRTVLFVDDARCMEAAVVAPVLARSIAPDVAFPYAMHTIQAGQHRPRMRTDDWARWLQDLALRVERHTAGRVPEPGRWSPRHLAVFAELDALAARASRCMQPGVLAVREYGETLDAIANVGARVAAAEPFLTGSETLEAESRTSLALELTTARALAVLGAPCLPDMAATIGDALGMATAPSLTPWSDARALLPSGTVIDRARLSTWSTTVAT